MFKKNEKIFSAKECIFALECIYSFYLSFFFIWQVVCECIYSLKHIPLSYFRSVPRKMKLKIFQKVYFFLMFEN